MRAKHLIAMMAGITIGFVIAYFFRIEIGAGIAAYTIFQVLASMNREPNKPRAKRSWLKIKGKEKD